MINLNENYRKVDREKALEFVMRHNLSYWSECSAKENINISEIFTSFYNSKFQLIIRCLYFSKIKI